MNKFIKILLTLVVPMFSFAQCPTNTNLTQPWTWPAHSNWYFGSGNIHNFNTGITTNSNSYPSYEGVSSVSDDQGNLLFFTNGRNLWRADGTLMSNVLLEGNEGGGTGDIGSASQGIITIRHPFDPDDYYVLTTDDALGGTLGLNYVVVGKNGVVKSGPTRLGGFRTTEGIAATLHRNGLDVWVTVHESGSTNYHTYLLTCSGFDPNPVISGGAPPDVTGDKERGGLAFSPDGSKFVQGHPDYWPNSDKEITIYDFNNLTGQITNGIHISPSTSAENPYDITFSTDGQMIYFTSGGTGVVWSMDISSGVQATMESSLTNTGYGGGGFSAIEIGHDGQIYTAGNQVTSIGGDNLGTANLGLPTMYIQPADSVEIQPVGEVRICDLPLDLSTLWYCKGTNAENTPRYENAYSMESSSGAYTLDPITGIFNTEVSGEYRVRFQICDIYDTLTFKIVDCDVCTLDLKNNVEICLGETFLLDTMFNVKSPIGDWTIDSVPNTSTNDAVITRGTDTIFDASDLSTKVGTYKLKYTINSGNDVCIDYVYITVNPLPYPDLGNDTYICDNTSVIIDAGNYVSYLWSPNGETTRTINVSTTGQYIVGVIDNNGCIGSDTINLTVNPLPKPNLGNDTSICFGNSVTLDAGNYTSFNWLPNGETTQTINVSTTGEYIVDILDVNGCGGKDTINVTIVDLPDPDVLVDASVCPGMNHTFDISPFDNGNGPYTYSWNDNSTNNDITVSVGGIYWVDITDSYGCVGRGSAELTINDNLTPIIVGSPLINICEGDSFILMSNYLASDGYNFNWSTGVTTESIVVNTTGTYDLYVDNGLGCEGDTTIEVVVNPLPVVVSGNDDICDGDQSTFGNDLGNGYTYLWKTSGETTYNINVTTSGDYERVVTTSMGCKDSSIYTLVVNPLPIVDLGNDVEVCDETLVNLSVISVNGYVYNWNSGETTNSINPITSGNYELTVTDNNGCVGMDNVDVTFIPKPILDLGNDITMCFGDSVVLNSNSTLTTTWNTGVVNNSIVVSESGTYIATIFDGLCSDSDTVTVTVINIPVSELDKSIENDLICFDDYENGIDLISGVGGRYEYVWNTGETSNILNINDGGLYIVTITDNGCFISDSVRIKTFCPHTLYVPNAFTTNDDGLNDTFLAYGHNIVNFKMLIFDRWGLKIFESNDINIGWDGTYNNNLVQQDVYVWKVYYTVYNNKGELEQYDDVGIVTVIK